MKTILPYCKAFVLLIAVFFAFSVLSCLLPDKSVKEHIKDSVPGMVAMGPYPRAVMDNVHCQMDNFTDALIMNQIYNIDRHHPVRAAMEVVRSSERGKDWDQAGLLQRRVNGEVLGTQQYARYWHGNTFLFRLFFLVMDFDMIRWTLFIVSSLLLVLLLCAYDQKVGLAKTLVLTSGFLATLGFITQFSMQFFPVLALTIIGCLLVIRREGSKSMGLLFFVIGALTCYFDLLTTPLLTLGMPLVVMLSLDRNMPFSVKDNLLKIIKVTLLWGLGFALTFVTKWALASLVMGQNIFADAYEVSLYRMEADEFTRWDALARNFNMLKLWMIIFAMVILIVFSVIRHQKFNIRKAVLFLLVGLMPYVWYLVLSNHSYLHWWFTYRLQAVSVTCLLMMVADSFGLQWDNS